MREVGALPLLLKRVAIKAATAYDSSMNKE